MFLKRGAIFAKIPIIYTIAYTCSMLFVGCMSLFGYVFVPKIPFFYLLILVLCILQIIIFFKVPRNKMFQVLYFANVFSSILLIFSSKFLVGTAFFMIDSILIVLISGRRFFKSPIAPLWILVSWIIHFIGVSSQINEYIKVLLFAGVTSIFLTCVYTFIPYPPIELIQGGEMGDKIYFGYMAGDEIDENDYMEVRNIIDLGIVSAVQVEDVYLKKPTIKETAIRNTIEQEAAKTTIIQLLKAAKEADIQKAYMMFSEDAKGFGVGEDDIKEVVEVLQDEIYQSADLSTLLIKDEYHYEKGRIIRNFTYEFYTRRGAFGIIVKGTQEAVAKSKLNNEGCISKIVIYPLSSHELRHQNLPDYGIYIFTNDKHLLQRLS